MGFDWFSSLIWTCWWQNKGEMMGFDWFSSSLFAIARCITQLGGKAL